VQGGASPSVAVLAGVAFTLLLIATSAVGEGYGARDSQRITDEEWITEASPSGVGAVDQI
jgi:hypothetical protein